MLINKKTGNWYPTCADLLQQTMLSKARLDFMFMSCERLSKSKDG